MNYEIVGIVVAALIMIFGGIASLYKVSTSIRKERDEENQRVLNESKSYTDNQVRSIKKELDYHKEIHEGKVAELSEKIEQLREEMRGHHRQLVELLTKMIDKN